MLSCNLRIGDDVILHYNRPTTRCTEITIDPATGIKREDKEPLETLRKHRQIDPEESPEEAQRRKVLGTSPKFCVNFSLTKCGKVSPGDVVYVQD